PVVIERAAVAEQNAAACRVELRRVRGVNRDAALRVELRRLQQQALGSELTREVFLRQRRTLIRQKRLAANERDGAVEAELPQRHDGLRSGLTAADDDETRAHAML